MEYYESIEFEDRYIHLFREPEIDYVKHSWCFAAKGVDMIGNQYRVIWPLITQPDGKDTYDWDDYRVLEA